MIREEIKNFILQVSAAKQFFELSKFTAMFTDIRKKCGVSPVGEEDRALTLCYMKNLEKQKKSKNDTVRGNPIEE